MSIAGLCPIFLECLPLYSERQYSRHEIRPEAPLGAPVDEVMISKMGHI